MSKPPLHALQSFVAVAREGNLTRAAALMHLTVSALSHQMRALEQRLDQRLFVRGPRGLSLTVQGQALLESLGTHIDAIERAFVHVGERRSGLTVSALPSFASSWLMPRLPRFMAQHPGLEFNLRTSAALVDFDREPVDCALRLGDGVWAGLTAEHLFDEWIAPVASPQLIARIGNPKRVPLARWPLLGEPEDDNHRWRRWFAEQGGLAPRKYAASFSDAELLHKAAAEGLGVALGRLLLAQPLIENGSLVVLSTQRMPAEYGHYFVYPARSATHSPLLAFRDWLQGEIRNDAKPATRKKRTR